MELYLGEECNRADVEDKMRKGDVDLVIYCQMLTVGYDNALIAAVAPCYPMG